MEEKKLNSYKNFKLFSVVESLSYPDFTVVALYKKLVIGCGFLVPDVSHNEAYISFLAVRKEWQRAGIASFMLYHLVQVIYSNKKLFLSGNINFFPITDLSWERHYSTCFSQQSGNLFVPKVRFQN